MNIEEKITWLERELKELKEEVTEKQEKKENKWKPKEGEDFWYIDEDGEVYGDYMCAYHESKYRIGNIFKTEDGAQFMVERLKVLQELKQFARPFKPYTNNFCMYYNYNYDYIDTDSFIKRQQNELYFESAEMIQKAIESIGEDRIKKYYLLIPEGE